MQTNGHIESFNGRLWDECPNANWFVSLARARADIETWRNEYNCGPYYPTSLCA